MHLKLGRGMSHRVKSPGCGNDLFERSMRDEESNEKVYERFGMPGNAKGIL